MKITFFIHLNLANEGAILGVDDAYNVEMPVVLRKGVPHRKAARFDERITAEIRKVGQEQHLLAQVFGAG